MADTEESPLLSFRRHDTRESLPSTTGGAGAAGPGGIPSSPTTPWRRDRARSPGSVDPTGRSINDVGVSDDEGGGEGFPGPGACCGGKVAGFDRSEFRAWWHVAWPTILTLSFRLVMNVTDLAFLGYYGTDYLAAGSLAMIWQTMTSAFLQQGFCAALSILCSQAFGAKQHKLVGDWAVLGAVVVSLLCLPLAVGWWFTADILTFVGLEDNLASLAGKFARYSLIWLWPQAMFSVGYSYLQAQSIMAPQLVAASIFVVINAGLNYVLIFGWAPIHFAGLGFIGSPIATAVSRVGQWLVFLIYIRVRGVHRQTWTGLSWRAFQRHRIKRYLKQAVPLAIGNCLEDWQIQTVAFMAGKLGPVEVATHTALINSFFFLTATQWGFSDATNVRVGYHLGGNRPRRAKGVALIHLCMAVGCGLVVGAVFVLARDDIGRVFSNDPAVWKLTSDLAEICGLGYVFLALFYVSMAVLGGQGRPGVVAVSFFVGAWLVSVPCAYVFGFVLKRGLVGLWDGMVAGYSVVTLISGGAVLLSNWRRLAQEAMERSEVLPSNAKGDVVV